MSGRNAKIRSRVLQLHQAEQSTRSRAAIKELQHDLNSFVDDSSKFSCSLTSARQALQSRLWPSNGSFQQPAVTFSFRVNEGLATVDIALIKQPAFIATFRLGHIETSGLGVIDDHRGLVLLSPELDSKQEIAEQVIKHLVKEQGGPSCPG